MKVLLTGVAGFIGSFVAKALLARSDDVVGIDNLNSYYDVNLKHARLEQLTSGPNFSFLHADISDRKAVETLFTKHKFDSVIHLAAQAGVRFSIENPHAYIESNIVGFTNIIECCRRSGVGHFVFASSSSVYGANATVPFSENHNVDHPISLYAATKKSNELIAHSYAHLFKLPSTGLRFFTVYGPWGRPDMAYFSFTKDIIEGTPINVFNNGNLSRDFTYIDDIVEGVIRTIDSPAGPAANWSAEHPDPATSNAPYRVYNIGNNHPVNLLDFIAVIEKATGKKAHLRMLPMQPGDVERTFANIDALSRDFDFRPATSLENGLEKFVSWYRSYFKV